MCRMYAHLAAEPLSVAGVLLDQRHSLLAQSVRDWRCETHRDGWGIGYFADSKPRMIKRPTAAPDDPEFRAAAQQVTSNVAIGHVRQASVGDLCPANAHPFVYGQWMFAHNGTVTGFDKLREQLAVETDAELRQQVGGTTDSEQVFFWLLSRLRRAGQPAEGPCRDLNIVAWELAAATRELADRSAATRANEPSRLNFLLTDGQVLLASRWKHTLYWTNLAGPLPAVGTGHVRGVAIASEAIGEEPWAEVPEGHVLSIDADLVTRWTKI